MAELTTAHLLLFVGLGVVGGTLSGLLGIGGGLVIVPLLLYVPVWFGFPDLGVRTASAVAVIQVTAATLSGALAHRRRGAVSLRLAITMSVASAAGALIGGIGSAFLPPHVILTTIATLATLAAGLMFVPRRGEALDANETPPYNPLVVLSMGFPIGLIIGLSGVGAFLMTPALIFVVGLTTRMAVGTVLAVGFPTAVAGAVGRLATGQVPLAIAAAVVVGAVVGAQIGSWISARTPPRMLRWLYGAIILIIASGLWWDILNGGGR